MKSDVTKPTSTDNDNALFTSIENDDTLFAITVDKTGEFRVFDANRKEELEEIPDHELIKVLFDTRVDEAQSFFSPIMTFLKQNSGIVFIGGRRFRLM